MIVYRVGRLLRDVSTRTGHLRKLVQTGLNYVGLSLARGRLLWAENHNHTGRLARYSLLASSRFETLEPRTAKGRRLRHGEAGLAAGRTALAPASAARERTTQASRHTEPQSEIARSGPETALSGPRSSLSQRAKRQLRELDEGG